MSNELLKALAEAKVQTDLIADFVFSVTKMRANLMDKTWEEVIAARHKFGWSVSVGQNAGRDGCDGALNFFFGPNVGSGIDHGSGNLIMVLPNRRLLVVDLRNEIAQFMDYSDDAACVAIDLREDV